MFRDRERNGAKCGHKEGRKLLKKPVDAAMTPQRRR
jgi:hypothetical protein